TTGSATVTLLASTNINLSIVGSGSGTLNLTATNGAISDNTTLETANLVTTGTVNLVAKTGIGASGAADIDTTIGTLSAINSTSGSIYIQETSALIIGGSGVATQGGNGDIIIDVVAGDLTVNTAVSANGSGKIRLDAVAGAIAS